ncbi:hypothetical protein [Streptomyces sp. NBC_01363]|nr:hypothetical protein [Streptomyces sp. NBC_01363]MCX4734390.1 hypothetical protein [Streptomyces sp. NBC_01363]
MSNFAVKRNAHQHWPQPTRDPTGTIDVAPHYKTAPISPPGKAPRNQNR